MATNSAGAVALKPWLARLRMRSVLDEREQAAIASLPFEMATYDANRDFVRLGERTSHACVIVSGLAGRFDQTASGARQITALHIPGDAADLHSVPVPHAGAALQALTQTRIAHIPHEALRALAAQFPAVAMAFWRDCVVDAAILSKWVLNIGRASARQRIAHLLCEMTIRHAASGADARRLPFPATQAHIGDMVGLTNVHVSRTLKRLTADGLVRLQSGVLEVHDWRRLVRDADFDPLYLHIPSDDLARIVPQPRSDAKQY